MKFLNWMFASAVALSFAACSNNEGIEEGANGNGVQQEEGTTYAALSLNFNNQTSRANTPGEYDQNGTDEENKVQKVRLIVVNAANEVEYNDEPDLAAVASPWKKQAFTIKLTPGQKKFYAVLNEDIEFNGTTADDLKTYLTETVSSDVNAVARGNYFMMTSVDEVVAYLQNNVTASEAQAGKNNVSILVDRVAAKVQVQVSENVQFVNDDYVKAGNNFMFALGNSNLMSTSGYSGKNGYFRMQQHNVDNTAWTTPYTDFEPVSDAVHTTPADDEYGYCDDVKYCLENVHSYGTDAATSKYKQGNTTYAAIRIPVIVKKKANLSYIDGVLTVGEALDRAEDTAVPFFFVKAAQAPYQALVGQYIMSSDLEALGVAMAGLSDGAASETKKKNAIAALAELGITLSEEYSDGRAYFKAWINPDYSGYSSPVFRNNWYKLTINSVTFPGDPNKPSISVSDPLKVENNAQITVSIRNWNLVENNIDLE